jgi:hypothetical protein
MENETNKIIDLLAQLRAKEVMSLELYSNKQDILTQLEQFDIFFDGIEATALVDRCDTMIKVLSQGGSLS